MGYVFWKTATILAALALAATMWWIISGDDVDCPAVPGGVVDLFAPGLSSRCDADEEKAPQ